ncbi:carbohydrate-binding protein [Streptomyces sp. NBC_01361]|uniref:carbohydrate-binding protein n=1 Tax=Streptomyces sp. NBC_01361 TaxID=2903838 RepID=UPI002E372117|nr:carbohydrate-binding protein [Streptomyces sp. NBC_01361]
MAPADNGEGTPADDDPFGYLYADGQAAGATPPSGGGGYGYPGPRSYHQVRPVGERQYGQQPQQAPTAAYGQAPPQQQPQGYGQPNAHYSAPETLPGGAPTTVTPTQHGGGGGRGRGPNTKGLLIGALAVVAAVVIGIGVAVLGGDSNDDAKGGDAGGQPSGGSQSVQPSETASKKADEPVDLPKTDAKALKLEGGTVTASDVKGAKADGGTYVAGFNQVGAKLTWTVNGIPKDGAYSLRVNYGVPGKNANATITVNGKVQTRPLNMENFSDAKEGDWEKGWTNTWSVVQLSKGTNAISISCEQGNQCDANFDQMWLVKGSNG